MDNLSEWPEIAWEVIRSPGDFFRTADRSDGFGQPLFFAVISFVISGILTAVGSAVFAPIGLEITTAAFSVLLASVVGGIIGLFIGAGLVHIFVYLFGGRGYRNTFEVGAYATALAPVSAVIGFIPVIGGLLSLAVTIYLLYVWIKGLENYHDLTAFQAALSVILPAVILGAILLLVILMFTFALFSGEIIAPTP